MCPNCGRSAPISAGRLAARVLAVLILIVVPLPAALVGACATVLTLLGGPAAAFDGGIFSSGILLLLAIAAFVGSIFIARWLWKL